MGVVNITPDSFSDGGRYLSREAAVEQALRLQSDSADLLDLGAESTRPGSQPVPIREQLNRLLPVLEVLQGLAQIPISIDTTSSAVARECLKAGAVIINDISGFHYDAELPAVCAESEAGVVLMHVKGTPETMQQQTKYENMIGEVREYLGSGIETARSHGISCEYIVVDPGLGFGKSFEQNYRLLGSLNRFGDIAAGVLVGPSRKAFTGEFSQLPPEQRQFSTAAAVALAVLHGADIARVHDVKELRQVTDIVDKFRTIQASTVDGTPDR